MKHQDENPHWRLSEYLGVLTHLVVAGVLAFSKANMSPLFVVMLASGMLCVANIATRHNPTFPSRHRPLYVMIGLGVVLPLLSMFFTRLFYTDDGFVWEPFRIALFSLVAAVLAWSVFTGFRQALGKPETSGESA